MMMTRMMDSDDAASRLHSVGVLSFFNFILSLYSSYFFHEKILFILFFFFIFSFSVWNPMSSVRAVALWVDLRAVDVAHRSSQEPTRVVAVGHRGNEFVQQPMQTLLHCCSYEEILLEHGNNEEELWREWRLWREGSNNEENEENEGET